MSQQMLPQLVRIADWYSIYALVQHSPDAVIYRLDTIRDTDKLRKRLVATWAEFQQSVVERNITFSQMKKVCISQDTELTFFRCGGQQFVFF